MNNQKKFDLEKSLQVSQISLAQLFRKKSVVLFADLFLDNLEDYPEFSTRNISDLLRGHNANLQI